MQSSFLQSGPWANFKRSRGWKVHKLFLDKEIIFALERPLPFGKSFLYAPEVCLKNKNVKKLLAIIRDKIRDLISERAVLCRLELNQQANQDILTALEQTGFRKAFEQIQPEHRQIISLKPPIEEILKQMKPKGRYNINIARRHGVRVTQSDVKDFYQLYFQVAKRDKFSARTEKYFVDLLKHMGDAAEIFVARLDNKPLAAALVIFWADTATYLYGGSSSNDRNVMAPYLLHWKIIEEAKRRKMDCYDMLAIAPDDNARHKFAGLRRFKQQFGGKQVDLVGSWDLIFKPWWYIVFRWAEKIRRK